MGWIWEIDGRCTGGVNEKPIRLEKERRGRRKGRVMES